MTDLSQALHNHKIQRPQVDNVKTWSTTANKMATDPIFAKLSKVIGTAIRYLILTEFEKRIHFCMVNMENSDKEVLHLMRFTVCTQVIT